MIHIAEDMFGEYSESEAVRQDVHTRLIIRSTGVLPVELEDRAFPRILDIGCAGGTWIYEMSFYYAHSTYVGTDAHPQMVKNASMKNALRSGMSFKTWDPFSSEVAPFPEESFDLITLHFASRWVPNPLAWLQLLNTCRLYLKCGGLLLLQENDGLTTTSDVLTHLEDLTRAAHKITGRSLTSKMSTAPHRGDVVALMSLLRHAHFPAPAVSCASVDFSYTHEEENFAWRDYLRSYIHQLTPYLVRVGVATPEELCELSMKLDMEMFRDDFCGIWTTFTLVARKP